VNRAERRRIQKKQNKKEPIYNISEQNLYKIKENVAENAVETAMTLLFSLTIRVMKEHYGWGHKRLPELADLLCDAYQEFDESGRTLQQEAEYTYQMTGVKFSRNLD
jgi:hypothetical protein